MPGVAFVPRNDIPAARRWYQSLGRPITADEWRVLRRTQDDPAELERVATEEGWEFDPTPRPSYLDELLGRPPRN